MAEESEETKPDTVPDEGGSEPWRQELTELRGLSKSQQEEIQSLKQNSQKQSDQLSQTSQQLSHLQEKVSSIRQGSAGFNTEVGAWEGT